MGHAAAKLADFSCDASGLRSIFDVRRGEGKTAKVYTKGGQLRLSPIVYATGSVGDWLCDGRGGDIADHSTEQVAVSGAVGWP